VIEDDAGMSRVIATYCQCGSVHEPECPLPVRFAIKEQVCRDRGIISYIPEDVAKEIDERVIAEMHRRQKTQRGFTNEA